MSQPPPPPPPNQPPQGGFGAPQDPPPGGFGAPQDPPPGGFGAPTPPPPAQGPGYGYPQTPPPPQAPAAPQSPPPTPPQGQPQQPYGYPQTPPPPAQPGYGYPGQQPQYGAPGQQPPYGAPGQQTPYGYPQPQTMPMQPQAPQGGGGGRKFNSQVVIIVAAVAAVALIIGGGVWYASSSGKDDSKNNSSGSSGGIGGKDGKDDGKTTGSTGKEKVPSNTSSTVLFQIPAPAVKDDDSSVTTVGSWLTDKVYAKSGNAEVDGYDPKSGAKLWTIKLPGPVCQASRHSTDANRTAIIYEPAMPTKKDPSHGCSQLAALDLDTGTKLWTKTVKSGDEDISLDNVTVSANTVAAGSTSGGAAFDISTGKQLWAPKPTDSCYDAGYGGGDKLVAVRKCGEYGSTRQLHIQTIDPKSGTVISEYKMSPGIEYASVVSTNPLVVAADVGDSAGDGSGISDFFSIDNKTGKLRTRISAPGKTYAARCDGITRIEYCFALAVGNDKLYIPTEEHDGSGDYSRTNEIVSFDLATGKQTGQRADAGDGYSITPLRMDGGNLLAYKSPPYDKGGQVVSIDGTSFKETKLLENPSTEATRDAETSMLPDYAELIYKDGRLYMSAVYASKLSVSDDKEYLAMAFGAQ
ncbi:MULTISPECIES: PQQ-binding-like beta-propeller repeat protein [unclassified Streptomyces]|uniref:outer membrane protein assembly factor BamB family protein n=1 Tax=unclassified Streptomyces TaxID=2593676 RepID=UPI002E7FF7DB|nr:PQQ-binding-like beta-propeller repeat protein [Streptomyces sp. NBC_00589]WTI38626.1 PQQ-binding-like beta-propeller repeat protein [Streptomyces sp. NBC_00775]WUB27695.1 PQQ-binding-like beta-propeller repeat protein [Streptomyces sp. NBC_00589]